MVGRGVLRFKKGVCSKRVSGSVVLEAFSSRARFICTTVVQIGVARVIVGRCMADSGGKNGSTKTRKKHWSKACQMRFLKAQNPLTPIPPTCEATSMVQIKLFLTSKASSVQQRGKPKKEAYSRKGFEKRQGPRPPSYIYDMYLQRTWGG